MHKGNTHAHLCLVLEYGNGLFPAGRVTAGAAVQLVLRLQLVGHSQDFPYLFLRRLGISGGMVLEVLSEVHIFPHRLHLLFLSRLPADALLHVQLDLESGNELLIHRRAFNAASGTHIHLYETALDFTTGHTFTQINTIVLPVDIELPVSVPLLLGSQHRIDHAVGHGIQAVYLWVKCGKWPVFTVLDYDVLFLQPFVYIIEI